MEFKKTYKPSGPYRPSGGFNRPSGGNFRPNYGRSNYMVRGKYYRLNHYIQADQVRALDEDNKQIGIMTMPEALRIAQEQGLDVVEIASSAKPVVVKIIDFKKFKYEESKKEAEARKKTKETITKEIWLTPNMAEHDLNVKLARVKEFLTDGDRVKLTVKFTGRQMAHTNLGFELLKRIFENVADLGQKDREPRLEGRRIVTQIAPNKAKV